MKMEKNQVVSELENTVREFLQQLNTFDYEAINRQPEGGGWSAAQVGRHLQKSYKGIGQLLLGPGIKTERDPAEKIDRIKSDFLNFESKMQSPEFVIPTNKSYDKDVLTEEVRSVMEQIQTAAASVDLSETCVGFSLPVYGPMTRLEWIYFVIYHTQRHIHQLKKIASAI
jgi:hypothetical protein